MRKIHFSILLIFCFTTLAWSQVAMGKWRTHFAYNSVSQIAQSENKIFAVSEGALYSIDKLDGGMEFYSKITGLNGSNITRIEYEEKGKQLIIIYGNGNIDIMSAGGITNIPDFFNKQMSATKNVNHINIYGSTAYLSCSFGIIALNTNRKEISDTYIIGPNASDVNVLNTTINNDSIYAVTSNVIYRASVTEPNLVNYEFWTKMTGLPGVGSYESLVSYEGKMFLLSGGKLYIKASGTPWQIFRSDLTVTGLNVSGGKLNLFAGASTYLVDSQLDVTEVSNLATISDADFDATTNTFWFAATDKGVISYNVQNSTAPTVNVFKPVGPAVNSPWEMKFSGEKLFVVPGGRWASQDGRSGAVMIYEAGVWNNITESSISEVTGSRALDFMNVAIDPSDKKHFFITSYGTGLYEFKNDKFDKWYNSANSIVECHPAALKSPNYYTRLDGAVYDSKGNMYFSNCAVNASVKVVTSEGKMEGLTFSGFAKETLGKILINRNDEKQKWMLSVRYAPGICIFDDNSTITDQSDDKSVFISSFSNLDVDGASITPTQYYSIAQDNNGVIWVGTDQGPLLFSSQLSVFETGFTCSRVKIPRDDGTGLADYLLESEKIKAIAIDGANRKWIGTETSGVYLMSENGQETIQHFTSSNSPLLSNDILSIAINPKSGEVFIGTGLGLVSYQSDASLAEESFSNVHAYPNPVREGFTGVITITGLVENTQVKITDIKGNLVCETVSNGSLATWDGKDVHGRKVSTGIYLAICASSDGTQSTITKILVVN